MAQQVKYPALSLSGEGSIPGSGTSVCYRCIQKKKVITYPKEKLKSLISFSIFPEMAYNKLPNFSTAIL